MVVLDELLPVPLVVDPLVPVTTTSAFPSTPAGVMAVTAWLFTTRTSVAGTPPTVTAVVDPRDVPRISIGVPPAGNTCLRTTVSTHVVRCH